MPFYEFRSYVGTSGIIRESDQNPTTLIERYVGGRRREIVRPSQAFLLRNSIRLGDGSV